MSELDYFARSVMNNGPIKPVKPVVKLGIGLPLSFHMIPSAFFDSFIQLEKPGINYTVYRTSKGGVDDMRNEIVKMALNDGVTHLIMMDTDQVYDPQTITRLLSHGLPIVGCLVYRRYPPFDPLMLKGSVGKYQTITAWEPGDLVEVDATGTGCVLFDIDVFRKMPEPWFKFRKNDDDSVIGEDIGFCADLREAGYRIYVDTSIPAGHLSQFQVTGGTWKLFTKLREAQAHSIEHGICTMGDSE